ncbi:hypothetical protein [Humibacter ginsenosidimutans]|uniref:Uncharacterized protein n=1 Tax=Humibacter ginsenosidimutans TaxID=2599293 RepID=A0A5B8M6Z1_9MICO|nr:hypothetical protein [Humibacter ginsenosidimutans]QDZ16498.1 hypothetical protein FPZ11_18655 [Humibacter ginsenosidimutans]
MSRLDARATHMHSGVSRLRTGTMVIADLLVVTSIIRFAYFGRQYPLPWLGLVALALLVLVAVLMWVMPAPRDAPVEQGRFAGLMAGCAVIVGIDLAASWAPGSTGVFPVTCIGVGGLLVAAVTVRPPRDIVLATAGFALVLIVVLGLQVHTVLSIAPRLAFVAIACAPPIIGVTLVRSFRSIVQFHSEIAQTQSTTIIDHAVGMLASEELERLDLAAEQLLDDVAAGRQALPLDPETAARASSLATQLRLHLVEDRRQTWLHHAVTESAVLDPVTVVDDPDGLAASLNSRQRDGLFSAIWLLVGSVPKSATSLRIHLARGADAGPHVQGLQIVIEATGIPRRQIDPAAWQAIRRVGRYTETGQSAMLRIEVDCLVDASADR